MTDTQKRLQELLVEQNRTNPNRSFEKWLSDLSLFVRMNLRQHSCYQVLLDLINSMYRFDGGITVIVSQKLNSLFDQLEAVAVDDAFFLSLQNDTPATTPQLDKSKIFIVHGHDSEARKDVEIFIKNQSYTPIVLADKPNSGLTIIQKLQVHTDVGYAIILYTPCDMTNDGETRARQNVVLEHGYLMRKLGLPNICILKKGDVVLPSDIAGLGYTTMDDGNSWKLAVVKELQAAGYPADANKIL